MNLNIVWVFLLNEVRISFRVWWSTYGAVYKNMTKHFVLTRQLVVASLSSFPQQWFALFANTFILTVCRFSIPAPKLRAIRDLCNADKWKGPAPGVRRGPKGDKLKYIFLQNLRGAFNKTVQRSSAVVAPRMGQRNAVEAPRILILSGAQNSGIAPAYSMAYHLPYCGIFSPQDK